MIPIIFVKQLESLHKRRLTLYNVQFRIYQNLLEDDEYLTPHSQHFRGLHILRERVAGFYDFEGVTVSCLLN